MCVGRVTRAVGLALALAQAAPVMATETTGRAIEIPPQINALATSGHVQGESSIIYLLAAEAGERLIISFAATNPDACFSISPPGSDEEIFEGESGVNSADIILREAGQYRIHVYLMEAAARRGEAADFRLRLRVAQRP